MRIKSATIIKGHGSDKIILHTDLPEACWPYTGEQALDFTAAANSGEEYLKKWFPFIIDIKIIERYVK